MFIALYVDDLLLFSNSLKRLIDMKQQLSRLFEMKDLGEAHYILGIQIQRNRTTRTLKYLSTGIPQECCSTFRYVGISFC